MSMRSKLSQALAKGIELERDRCMGICIDLIQGLQRGLNKKLMTAGEKHLAELKLSMGKALIGAVQMKIMTGEQSHAQTETNQVHRPDPFPLGETPGGEDGGRAS